MNGLQPPTRDPVVIDEHSADWAIHPCFENEAPWLSKGILVFEPSPDKDAFDPVSNCIYLGRINCEHAALIYGASRSNHSLALKACDLVEGHRCRRRPRSHVPGSKLVGGSSATVLEPQPYRGLAGARDIEGDGAEIKVQVGSQLPFASILHRPHGKEASNESPERQRNSRAQQRQPVQRIAGLFFRGPCSSQLHDALMGVLAVFAVCLVFGGWWLLLGFGGRWSYASAGLFGLAVYCFTWGLDAAWRGPHCHYGAEPQRYEQASNYSSPDPSTVAHSLPPASTQATIAALGWERTNATVDRPLGTQGILLSMLQALRERLRLLRDALDRPWVWAAWVLWVLIGIYDTVGSQLLPKAIRDRVPSIYEVVSVTSGWLPLWGWALLGMAIIVAAAVEYAAKKEGATPWRGARNQSPFLVSFLETYADTRGNECFFHTPLTVRNLSPTRSFDGVEVHLVRVTQMQPHHGGHTSINSRLIDRASGLPSFGMAPSMPRDVFLLRVVGNKELGHRFKLGPLERPSGREHSFGPGLYKVDIAIYGRDAQPAFEALAIGLDESGTLSYGAWRDDLPWPLSPRITTTISGVPSPQSPQDTPEKTQP